MGRHADGGLPGLQRLPSGPLPAAGARMAGRGRSGFRPDVEGMRAVAVVAVVAYHAGLPGVRGGYVGVDVFYVLSGFLITGLLWREVATTGRVSFAVFYARRARRLLPAPCWSLSSRWSPRRSGCRRCRPGR